MDSRTQTLLACVVAAAIFPPSALAQQPRPDLVSDSIAKLGSAFSAFAVDESASKTGKASHPGAENVVVGPIEFHRPKLSKPTWMDPAWLKSIAGTRRPSERSSQLSGEQRVSHRFPSHNQSLEYGTEVLEQSSPINGMTGTHLTPPNLHHHTVDDQDSSYIMGVPTPSHQVIRAPSEPKPRHPTKTHGQMTVQERAQAIHEQHEKTHPEHLSIRRRVQPEPAMIPGGREQATWKQPYSYGYFGASGERQWSQQYGYRDRYTQWSRR